MLGFWQAFRFQLTPMDDQELVARSGQLFDNRSPDEPGATKNDGSQGFPAVTSVRSVVSTIDRNELQLVQSSSRRRTSRIPLADRFMATVSELRKVCVAWHLGQKPTSVPVLTRRVRLWGCALRSGR
jgi:hypothetical protein